MSTQRGAPALLAVVVSTTCLVTFLATCLSVAPFADAQQTQVRLQLMDQTPWTTPKHPVLTITFEASNGGLLPLDNLEVGLTIGQAIRARLVYEQSLTQGPGPLTIYGPALVSQSGTLAPGQTRRFSVSVDISKVGGVSQVESLVYPAAVELLSAGSQVASLNTAEIHFVRALESPLSLTWWAEVTAPIAMDPAGRLADGGFETSIAPGGALRSEAEALNVLARESTRAATHIALEPAVLDQLSRMTDGYTRTFGGPVARGQAGAANAAAVLSDLRAAAAQPTVQISAMPFSAPLLPSLTTSGLGREIDRQRAAAASTVLAELGVAADPGVMRPPGGALDATSLQALAIRGVTTLLGDANTTARPAQPNDFAPPPSAELSVAGIGVKVLLPDPHVTALLQNQTLLADPVLSAQALLGEMATIWREDPVPVPPTVRGIALGLPANLPSGLWSPLLQRIGHAPFLKTAQPGDFLATVIPPGPEAALLDPSTVGFTRTYATAIRTERDNAAAYRSMLAAPSPLPDQLDGDLLYSEAGQYVGDEIHGRAWYDQVHNVTTGIFARAAPDTSQVFTFTSKAGTIPLQMGDPGPTPLKMVVVLRSSKYTFLNGDTQTSWRQEVVLTRARQIVPVRVEATASGQGVIEVFLRAPTGLVVSQGAVIVRSTAVNRIALIITLAAALVLAALWSRRLFRRRTS